MAEKKPGKSKRRLRNPETIREQALKAQTESGTPKRRSLVRSTSKKVFAPLKLVALVFRFKPLRWIGFVLAPPYLRNSWRELRLVTWPDRKQSRQLTTAVIIFSIVFGVLVWLVDTGLDKLFKDVIIK